VRSRARSSRSRHAPACASEPLRCWATVWSSSLAASRAAATSTQRRSPGWVSSWRRSQKRRSSATLPKVLFTRHADCSFVEVGEGGRATTPQRALEPLRCGGLQRHGEGWRYVTYERSSPRGMAALRTIDRGGAPSPAVAVADDTAPELELTILFLDDRIAAVRASPDGATAPALRFYDGDGGARAPWRGLPFAAGLPHVSLVLRSHGAGLVASALAAHPDGVVLANAGLTADGAESARLGALRLDPPTALGGFATTRYAAAVTVLPEGFLGAEKRPLELRVLDPLTLGTRASFAVPTSDLSLLTLFAVGDDLLLVDRRLGQERALRAAWLRCDAP
jgi:hypothetical protein